MNYRGHFFASFTYETDYADQIGKLKTSNMQFKGALDIFFTRATQNVPSPMEYAGIFTVGTVKARNEMGNSLQTYDFQVEAIQDLYRLISFFFLFLSFLYQSFKL